MGCKIGMAQNLDYAMEHSVARDKRDDPLKARFTLLPVQALHHVAMALTLGEEKHAHDDFECTKMDCTTLLVKGTSGHLKHRGGGMSMSSMLQHNDLRGWF